MEPTPPSDDPAARFRKPGDTVPPERPTDRPTEPPPAPYGFVQVAEDTLIAPLAWGGVFSKRGLMPPPDYGALAANVALYAAASLAINFLRFQLTFSGGTPLAAWQIAAGGGFILGFLMAASAVAAFLLDFLVRLSGGNASYHRSYQAVSLLSAFLPAVAAANAFPFGWLAVLALWTLLSAVAVENLHQAPPGRARALFCGTALACGCAVWLVSVQVDRYLTPFIQAARLKAQLERELREGPGTQATAQLTADPQTVMLQAQRAMLSAGLSTAAAPGGSSLDLVAGPSGVAPINPEQVSAMAQEMREHPAQASQAASNMLDSTMPLLDNPALTKGMPPGQAKQMKEMLALISQMQNDAKAGRRPSPAQAAKLMQMQQATMQMMMQNMQNLQKNAPKPKTKTPADGQ